MTYDIPSILPAIYLLVSLILFRFGMCPALEFPLSYNQLFYISLEWSIEYYKFLKPLPSIFECSLYQMFSLFCYSNIITNWKFWCHGHTTQYHSIPGINFSTLYFHFSYDLLPSESFLLTILFSTIMALLYWSSSKSSTSTYFLLLFVEKYLNFFS